MALRGSSEVDNLKIRGGFSSPGAYGEGSQKSGGTWQIPVISWGRRNPGRI
jgi:hypothetical protein